MCVFVDVSVRVSGFERLCWLSSIAVFFFFYFFLKK